MLKFLDQDDEQCAVCVDTLVESTDIPKGSKLSDISRKSIVSSISDFAAKGIVPKFCIVSITLPKTISKKHVQDISRGISYACKEFKIQLLGGDTNQGTEISMHVVLFGNFRKYIKRKNAKIGDLIFTGTPAGVGMIKEEDVLEGFIENIKCFNIKVK